MIGPFSDPGFAAGGDLATAIKLPDRAAPSLWRRAGKSAVMAWDRGAFAT